MADGLQYLLGELGTRFASLQLVFPEVRFALITGTRDAELLGWAAEGIGGGDDIEVDAQFWDLDFPTLSLIHGVGALDALPELAGLAADSMEALHYFGAGDQGVGLAHELLAHANGREREAHVWLWVMT